MPVIDERHDLAHDVRDDRGWSESYYFNAYAPATDTGFFTRVGIQPNEGTMYAIVWVWLSDGGGARLWFERAEHGMPDGVLEVGGVRFESTGGPRGWRIRAAGQGPGGRSLSIDATFEELTPRIGVVERDGTTGHFEQAGRWAGAITVDGTASALTSGRGTRDKSWGPHDANGGGGLQMRRWFSINVGDDTHFGGALIGTGAGEVHRGWVWTEGALTSVERWDIVSRLAGDGVLHEALDLAVHDKLGRTHRLHGDVLRNAALGNKLPGGLLVNEALTRWQLGEREGYGMSAYAHILDDAGHPLVAVT